MELKATILMLHDICKRETNWDLLDLASHGRRAISFFLKRTEDIPLDDNRRDAILQAAPSVGAPTSCVMPASSDRLLRVGPKVVCMRNCADLRSKEIFSLFICSKQGSLIMNTKNNVAMCITTFHEFVGKTHFRLDGE